jgi:hypothetical protein
MEVLREIPFWRKRKNGVYILHALGILQSILVVTRVNSLNDSYETETNFFKGLFWGSILSIPLWLSFFGWVKLMIDFINYL